jgi:hypothetical protein
VQSLLQGEVSPDTENYISRLIAAKGVSTGVEGTPFNTADLVRSLGLTSEQLMTSGLGAYNSLLNSIGSLQEQPGLMAEIGQSNAQLAAAPDPQQAVEQLIRTMQNEFGLGMDNPAGGTGTYHTLGPKLPGVSYPGGGPIGSPDNPFGPISNIDAVLTGGPGFNTPPAPGQTSTASSPWQDYLNSTFGYAMGNPAAPSSGTGTYSPDALGPNQTFAPLDNMVQDYLNQGANLSDLNAMYGDLPFGTP